MFLWAYGLLRVRTFHKNSHVYVNFHLGLIFVVSSALLYPSQVKHQTDLSILAISALATALPLTLSQLVFVAGLSLNRKTGQMVVLTCIPVLIGYLLSYFRYG